MRGAWAGLGLQLAVGGSVVARIVLGEPRTLGGRLVWLTWLVALSAAGLAWLIWRWRVGDRRSASLLRWAFAQGLVYRRHSELPPHLAGGTTLIEGVAHCVYDPAWQFAAFEARATFSGKLGWLADDDTRIFVVVVAPAVEGWVHVDRLSGDPGRVVLFESEDVNRELHVTTSAPQMATDLLSPIQLESLLGSELASLSVARGVVVARYPTENSTANLADRRAEVTAFRDRVPQWAWKRWAAPAS